MENPKVFISHASRDYRDIDGNVIPGNAITEIIKILDDNNIEHWIDEKGLISAKGWCKQIKDAIDSCNIFLYISSENANCSGNTANEIQYALDQNKIIIPFKLDKSGYHKDVYLNLIRIHFLRYYEDRTKALQDLILTIKNQTVQIGPSVRIKPMSNEALIKGKKLSELLPDIFNTNDYHASVQEFHDLIQLLECDSETGYNKFREYLQKLERLGQERNYNVRQSRLERMISDIKEDNPESERCVSILFILLKMYLYYRINDIKETIIIQKEVDDINFTLSFVEKNAQTINDVTNAVVKGGTFLLSAAALLMGKGGAAARGGIHASTRSEKIKLVDIEKAEAQKQAFETLKEVTKSLSFLEE